MKTGYFRMLFTLLAVLLLGSAAKAQTIHYVTPTGANPTTGNKWEVSGITDKQILTLPEALAAANAGDQIWVLGFEQSTLSANQLYVAPEGGFTVKSGVKLYGGFRGTERTIDERPTSGKAPYFTYRSVLSGDIKGDDVVDGTNMLYPANSTRSDNATHVLSLDLTPKQSSGNNNTYPTVVNGFTVIGGNADGTGEYGGGIYVFGANANGGGAYHIEKCFLLNNYAKEGGGAIYVSSQVEATSTASTIVDCVVYNNIAGERSGSVNLGGGINIVGAGTIFNSSIFNCEGGGVLLSEKAKAVNVTVARNTVMGIGAADGVTSQVVFNSVIWGNSKVQNPTATSFENCASDNATIAKGDNCFSISAESNGENGPFFEAPSVLISFDRDFDWKKNAYPTWSWGILEGSALIDKGDDGVYTGLPSTDLAGETRKKGTIDIGAYEYQHLDAGRIRYVKANGTGDGTSWENASGDLQKMIDELATVNAPGEVWVAAGTYRPTTQIIEGVQYAASFRMRDGINVYGGFAGREISKAKREKGTMPWIYSNETVLMGADYDDNSAEWIENSSQWNVISSTRHVVWFAPMSGEVKFKYTTVLDGVTIKGGAANGGEGLADFATDKGGGVYMGLNAILQNCIVTENTAKGDGGGVYANGDGADASSANAKGGRVVGCLIYNNSSVEDGGGVFVKNAGLVLRSMITNNSATNGAGVYLDKNAENHPEYLILSTSVVSNNTATGNGAVYCNESSVLLQNTIVNNDCPSTVDASNPNSSQTGGLYINKYAYVINSILWNNLINGLNIPMYALGATAENVRFYNNAISGSSNAVWNNIYQTSTLKLSDDNASVAIGPDFMGGYPTGVGVQGSLDRPSYYWEPKQGSNLRAGGLTIGTFPSIVLVSPELDIAGIPFAQKPAMGAHGVKANEISASNYVVFVDINYTGTDANGASWATPYKSLNEVLAYYANKTDLPQDQVIKIHVKEGDYWPRYAFTNLDPKTATLSIPALPNGAKFEIYGGYAAESDGTDLKNRFPTTYRTIIDGNHEGKNIDEGIYHCITVETGANVVLDGFHVINGYAAGTATLRYGAGMLVRDGANVTVRNSIFENNTAEEAAAIDARGATLLLINCVVNNNTNNTKTSSVINADYLTLNHVSVVNNIGAAPAMGTSSFAIGNSGGNTFTFASVGADGAKNFANPTNKQGATLGFDTYYGGYSNFTPLTSSADAGQLINKATETPVDVAEDIAGNSRNLGGSADMGAYEANLPVNGTVFYVTEKGSGKMDGSSWENAIAGNMIYDVTNKTNVNISTTDSRYIGFYDASARPYGETSGASKLFFEHMGEAGVINGTAVDNVDYKVETLAVGQYNDRKETHISGANRINIQNRRYEQYVGGLQYAVEQAAAAAANDGKQRSVWVAGGTYTDYKGFVIRDKVDVLGGFPNEGTPGEDDRRPLISQYIPANQVNEGLDKAKYETIIQIQAKKPWTYNGEGNPGANPDANLPGQTRKPVLFQPDVCLPTNSPSGRESSYTYYKIRDRWVGNDHWDGREYGNSVPGSDEDASNTYRYNLSSEQQNGIYIEYTGAMWDGFTIRHGFYTDYKANRDGGAGVRMFRGVTLQNCVVTDNYINAHNNAGRGAGIYCDGDNSKVVNCFVLNNANNSDESYGGGMYMILGTSYNTMVANNYAKSNGGGIFIEDAMFYNNTVAYNRSTGTGGLHQWTASSGTTTTLKLYNTIFYGNTNRALDVSKEKDGSFSFNGAWNCFIQTTNALDGEVQGRIDQNTTRIGENLPCPFESSNAQSENNYRLNSSTWCLNNGAENLGNDYQGQPVVLPYTDVDFTDRIKDCAVDVGAYEKDNLENIGYEIKTTSGSAVSYNFYVSVEGAGLRSGANPDNAACEMKLQQILTRAGELASANRGVDVIVKIAEGEYNANTLSEVNDPQSYTFVVPEGVIVEGGYMVTDKFGSRNPFSHKTILSPIANVQGQEINGYHAVTFGEPANKESYKQAIIDGVTLTGGKATSLVGKGNAKTQGGGAIVPAWGHIRNCRVYGNEAIQGGGLYLKPGALVSGTDINGNTADEGAGIYADNTDAAEGLRAHVVSTTVTENTATENAGGIYFADGGALFLNMVVWGNTATSDNNVSGPVYSTFKDSEMKSASIVNGNNFEDFFPFNYSFVERFELPSNMVNTAMTSDRETYFASTDERLRAFSPLVNNGFSIDLQKHLATNWNIAANDMQGISRIQTGIGKIDVGAYAFLGGVIPEPKAGDYMAKLFVNQTTNFQVANSVNLDDVIGRSFYTPLYHLDDALEYAKKAVKLNPGANIEIFVAQGTYKPTIRRINAATETVDQRQNSFVVPAGVNIYGGFSGEEDYSYGLSRVSGENGTSQSFTDITNSDISQYLTARETSDFNLNSINEPWELKNQTILSGDINASETVKNAYHVLYSDTEYGTGTVTLDGLTVMDGQTSNSLPLMTENNEIGQGGALYSNGINYIINRCRFLNNQGVRGNAAYVRNASATVIGSTFAGNSTVEDLQGVEVGRIYGGAMCMAASTGEKATLKAVNTLWANNETTGNGGAIGFAVNGGTSEVNLMNNTIVRNKAANGNGAIYAQGGTVTNTLVWGNEGAEGSSNVSNGIAVTYSAAEDLDAANGNNIKLATENTSIEGPRFAQPSEAAGAVANDPSSKWNPASINVLTDAGAGSLSKDIEKLSDIGSATGAYKEWNDNHAGDYATQYMGSSQYYRYAGPLDENGQPLDRIIDIGLYEYQYVTSFSSMDEIYVATTESGNGSGDGWANATSDLRGAIIAMANPTGGNKTDKTIYISDGEYMSKQLLTGTAFPLNMDKDADDGMNGSSLTIKGSFNEAGQQDFSNPTVISSYPGVATERLMNITTNGEPVSIEGIMFNNATANGNGIVSTGNNLTLARVAFRGNAGTGVSTSGYSLIYNALFADGGTGLNVGSGDVKVVNATFANNSTAAITGTASVFNSVSWKSGSGVSEGNNNAVLTAENDDIQNGPNFVDPSNENILLRDYRIRPSMMLLNKGNNDNYPGDLTTDVDLTSGKRLVDGTIDIGAYEYAAPLSQILYVKSGVVGSDESGESWTNAISDLQGAINLASIYADVNKGQTGYVFVHNNVAANNVRVAMPNVKAYGSMNDETDVDVSEILGKRSSLLDMERRSKINGLTVGGAGSVVDGFEVSGTVAVSDGMLSTSIVKPTDATGVTGAVSVTEKGVLYNSFVEGAVNGKAVNVTATGAIKGNGINNNPNAIENGYVSVDCWKYQLKDDSGLFDKAKEETITAYMEMAGHSKDLSGSIRVRNGLVDFGCFETWNITADTEISATDKPTRNHVVYVRNGAELKIAKDVYTGESTAFNPGFLLLEDGAIGLLANDNYVGLTNFAMERTIPADGTALTYVPFLIDKMDNASGATFQRYDGATRAAYNYQFGDGDAWVDVDPATEQGGVQAFAINGSADAKVRFYGTSYKETPNEDKMVQLMKFNFNDPWTTNADGTINPDTSNRFTHKENMSWNMFGSPYLHAMNYGDMEYGRVIYTGASYDTKNTADSNTSGSVAMGEGVFTQTATLQDYETFTVKAPQDGTQSQSLRGLLVTVAPADAEEADDFIQLKAVESEEASSEFNIAADGVKWMSDNASVAQIYMARNGGRYSMLSALDINGAVSLGLTIPQAAAYTIAIDEEAWMDEYETVVLEDKTTGQMVDLLEGAYQFQATEAGTVEDRFSIRFNRIVDGLGDNVKAYSPSAGMIRVEGAAAGSLVRIYDLNGRCIRVGETSVVNYDVNVGPKGIYLVEVQQKEAEPVVKKVQVK
mgnify:CR=1 FL=1